MTEAKSRGFVFAAGALGVIAAGCGPAPRAPKVSRVLPSHSYTDGPVALRVDTENVRPELNIDLGDGRLATRLASLKITLVPEGGTPRPSVPLEILAWDGKASYWVRTPVGLADGPYTLELITPVGTKAELDDAFEALGPDPGPPSIDVQASSMTVSVPAQGFVGAAAPVDVIVVVDDARGALASIDWHTSTGDTGSCLILSADLMAPPPLPTSTCHVIFDAPALSDQDPTVLPITFTVAATDVSGQTFTVDLPLVAAKAPVIDSFENTAGALVGNQMFFVHGRNFLAGTQVVIDMAMLGGPIMGGAIMDDQTIVGLTPPHPRAESVTVFVKAPGAIGTVAALQPFVYLPPPRPRDLQPTAGPSAGGTRVTVVGNDLRFGAQFTVEATPGERKSLYNVIFDPSPNNNKVSGCLPPGSGTVSLRVVDMVSGEGVLPDAFTYLEGVPGAAAPSPEESCLPLPP